MKIAEFEVKVERKPIKNIHLAVYQPDGNIHVSVPLNLSDDEVSLFLFSKLAWMRKNYTEIMKQERQPEREFVSGEDHYLLGQRYMLQVIPTTTTEKSFVHKQVRTLDLHVRPDATLKHKQEVMDEFYRDEIRAVLTKYVEKWAAIMNEEITTFSWKILLMQLKWGSCNTSQRTIQFNLLLARVPKRCIEYIVVHELVHLKVHKHDKTFFQLLEKYLPDWSARKKALDEFLALPLRGK